MTQIFESILIALQAIWANKLRSFMTVLGNIVAVTSIVTVVSLIQGMNAYVTNAIVSDVGADSFTIQQFGVVTSDEEFDKIRNNPQIRIEEVAPIRDSYDTGKPVPWIRVHDLPNYAYFDHSAHVSRGVGCVSCHGDRHSQTQKAQ